MTQILFRGALTEVDWRDASHLIRSVSNTSDPRNIAVLYWLVGAFCAAGALLSASQRGILIAATVGLVCLGVWTRSHDSRTWRATPSAQQLCWGLFTETGVSISTEHATSTTDWPAILRHRATGSLFILEVAPNQFIPFPRHFFASDSEWQATLELLPKVTAKASTLFTNLPPHVSRIRWLFRQVLLWLSVLAGILAITYLLR